MVKNIFKSKKALIIIVIFIVAMAIVVFSIFRNTNDQKLLETQSADTSETPDNASKQPTEVQQLTAPEPKTPDACSKATDAVKQVVGGDVKTSGTTATTNANSKVTNCNYSKGTQLVNVRIYEYGSDTDARADLSKLQLKGYSGQTKGKYNVVVSVVVGSASPTATTTSGGDTATSDKIVKLVVEKL